MDDGKVTRRVTLFWMLWLTTEVFRWAMVFAEKASSSSLEVAATLGAILTPLAGLHAAIFSFYRSAHYPPPQKEQIEVPNTAQAKKPTNDA